MKKQENKFKEELRLLENLKKKVEKSLKFAPEGSMRCELTQGKYPQYFITTKDTKNKYPKGKYLPKCDIGIAKLYAQKEYDLLMLKEIDKREAEIKREMRHKVPADINNVSGRMAKAKRLLITPYCLSDEEYAEKWEMERVGSLNPYPLVNFFTTEKGEVVRSKSEKIIADKLKLQGIHYKYEAPLILAGKTIYPDFTILDMCKRQEVYLEHFGMMDNAEYCNNALEKIEIYENNGLLLGERLFVTFESSLKVINQNQLDNLIKKFV